MTQSREILEDTDLYLKGSQHVPSQAMNSQYKIQESLIFALINNSS